MGSRRWLRGQSDVMVSLSTPGPLTTLGTSRSTGAFEEVRRVYEDFATALLVDPVALGADAAGAAGPGARPQSGSEVVEGGRMAAGVGELGGFRHRHDVGDAGLLEVLAQAGVLAELLVRGEPGERHAGRDGTVNHGRDLLRPGGELQLDRDAGLGAPGGIVEPRFMGDVELAVQEHAVAGGIDIGQKGPDLAVVDPTQRARVLPLHAGRFPSLLGEPGWIGDQHPTRNRRGSPSRNPGRSRAARRR